MADTGIRLIVGLGNPGPQYEATRHNVGFWLVERLAARAGAVFRVEAKLHGLVCRLTLAGRDVRLLKPATFMNRSGQSVAATARYFSIPPEAILIAHDELDLPPGTVRLKQGGGHAGHNGLRDTIAQLGSRDFWRLRIGIGHPGDKAQVVGYVLNRPTRDEGTLIMDAVDEAERSLPEVVEGAFQRAMNRLHGPSR
ncbi:aminoacyl-tRNA hydrolase [Thiococcus pfennigii]|jgi:PTH1 family peptidyl-tRNA hydrolase|uniref:aminoacyl-tRNA hydrolase n=1 Tax=Thiococcus pfennigii TaxID=1057 RepID=UPI001907EEE6|nr:aminoacyl-tRNA hydrolase [Thiococcus pfennigii]MBK1699700.1 aminoacyl-tRNA hydrolase [Thiococcus pfennigii]MBK1731549.1 aminoacyl-tRNA hydrolase [Thiococcus pfennigii]